MPRFGRAVLGGTFDRLHVGHVALLAVAMATGRRVAIGITTARFLRLHPKPEGPAIQSYAIRRHALDRWLSTHYPRSRYALTPLEDPFGGSVGPGVDALVVSAETAKGGGRVNRERRRRGLRPVPIVIVPLVLADDLRPVSSRRIRAGEIDRLGRRRIPIDVGVAVERRGDRVPAERAIRRTFPRARIRFVPVRRAGPGVAARRARRLAARARGHRELGLAIVPAGSDRIVVECSREVTLRPRALSGDPPEALRRALERLLRPSRAQRL